MPSDPTVVPPQVGQAQFSSPDAQTPWGPQHGCTPDGLHCAGLVKSSAVLLRPHLCTIHGTDATAP
eukprot:6903207-Prymnesium_polylepis.1